MCQPSRDAPSPSDARSSGIKGRRVLPLARLDGGKPTPFSGWVVDLIIKKKRSKIMTYDYTKIHGRSGDKVRRLAECGALQTAKKNRKKVGD